MQISRASNPLKNKTNVNPVINRPTEATAEDFNEIGSILENHADALELLLGNNYRADFLGYYSTKDLLVATFPNPPEDSFGIIVDQANNPKEIWQFQSGAYVLIEGSQNVLFFNSYANFPETGEVDKIYIAKDTRQIFVWWSNSYHNLSEQHVIADSSLSSISENPLKNKVIYENLLLKLNRGNYNGNADDIISYVDQIKNNLENSLSTGFKGKISISDNFTENGLYYPIEEGVYSNANNIEVDFSLGINILVKDVNGWSIVIVPIDTSSISEKIEKLERETYQLSNNLLFKSARVNTDGTFSNSANSLCTEFQEIPSNTEISLSGYEGVGTSFPRFVIIDENDNVLDFELGLGSSDSTPITLTTPNTPNIRIAVNISTRSGSGSDWVAGNSIFPTQFMINLGGDVLPYEPFKTTFKDESVTKLPIVFVSPNGNDDNLGYFKQKPVQSISKALDLVAKNGEIRLLEGDYFDENFDLDDFKTLRGQTGDRVRLIYGTRFESATLTSGTTRVYEANTNILINNSFFLWQHDIEDEETVILDAERHPFHRGKRTRLESTRVYPASSINEIENTTDKLMWWKDDANEKIYFSKAENSDLSINPIVIPSGGSISASNGSELYLENVDILYNSLRTSYCTGKMVDCAVKHYNLGGAIIYDNTTQFTFERVEVGGCNIDGFNGHVYTTVNFKYSRQLEVMFIDCWAHDCGDDGDSCHEYCRTSWHGGLLEYNGNGITPASGGHTTCYNVITRKNGVHPWTPQNQTGSGFSAQGSSLDNGISSNIYCHNCISIDDNVAFRGRDILDSTAIQCIAVRPVITAFSDINQIDCKTIN